MAFRFVAVKNKEISQIVKQAVPKMCEEGDEQVKLCLFDLKLSMKVVKRFFVYKCKFSFVLPYLADMFINKLKT